METANEDKVPKKNPLLVTSFEDDFLDLEPFADRLLKFIEVEHNFLEGSLVIALNGKYGSGKTTFFTMLQDKLAKERKSAVTADVPSEARTYSTVYVNAWESDYYGDPLFAIISAMVEQMRDPKNVDKLVSRAKKTALLLGIGDEILKALTGASAVGAAEASDKIEEAASIDPALPRDAFSLFQARKDAMNALKQELAEFINASKDHILFLIDELDRCRPDFAITYLETIKHIFDIPSATFLLAADRDHLENSARKAFGQNLDFNEYYRKFIHRELSPFKPTLEVYNRFSASYVNWFFESESLRFSAFNIDHYELKRISKLTHTLSLTPRQIRSLFYVLSQVLQTTQDKKGKLFNFFGVSTMFMSSLHISNHSAYKTLGTTVLSGVDLLTLVQNDLQLEDTKWWFTLLATGGAVQLEEDQDVFDILINVNLASSTTPLQQRSLAEWYRRWGRIDPDPFRDSKFHEIYKKIESVANWTT